MKKLIYGSFAVLLALNACKTQRTGMTQNSNFPKFSQEGHRGARGLYPENSIAAMKAAIDLPNITTLEMDCHITKDKKVVVYHDDFLNPKFVTYARIKMLAILILMATKVMRNFLLTIYWNFKTRGCQFGLPKQV